jgi:hypothetical protein
MMKSYGSVKTAISALSPEIQANPNSRALQTPGTVIRHPGSKLKVKISEEQMGRSA